VQELALLSMAAAAIPEIPRFVRIFFVRHGQSYNNTLLRISHQKFVQGGFAWHANS
jgi:hypothetical protein